MNSLTFPSVSSRNSMPMEDIHMDVASKNSTKDNQPLSRGSVELRGKTIDLDKMSVETPKFQNGTEIPSSPKEVRSEGKKELNQPSIHLRRLTAVGVGVTSVLRAVLAVGTLGISEGIRALASHIVESKGTQSLGKTTFDVTVPGSPDPLEVGKGFLPSRVPKGMTTGQLQKQVQEKINKGHELVSSLLDGTMEPGHACTKEDVSNIMFYVQARGENMVKHGFRDGACTLPDPGQRIRKFLDTCPQSYQRDSSHITAFQFLPGAGHRGIDSYGSGKNFDTLLPHGMKTLLFGSIPRHEAPPLKMPEERLYLKLETHGAWLTKPRSGDDQSGPHRTGNHHDIGAFLGHSLSFIITRFQKAGEGTCKERIPTDLSRKYESLIKSLPGNLQAILRQDAPLSTAGGVRIMADNLRTALRLADNNMDRKKIKTLHDQIFDRYPDAPVRFGNEALLKTEDILIDPELKGKSWKENQILLKNKNSIQEELEMAEKEYDRTLNMSDEQLGDEVGNYIEMANRRRDKLKPTDDQQVTNVGGQTVDFDSEFFDQVTHEVDELVSSLKDMLNDLPEDEPPSLKVEAESPPPTQIDTNALLDEAIESFNSLQTIIPDKN